ncbi:hypothetical protein QQF64_033502 [Cirrhinus molitorella]|uniref:Uncharacterized protein n=1 Tax=Cirrhinus molitorella TaxID=172907 RepID=A0ABR3MU45_9TELE
MPLSPRLWRAAVVLLQASKTAGLPAALIRGCLLGAGDKLAESVPSHSLSHLYTEGDPQACSIANLTTEREGGQTDFMA